VALQVLTGKTTNIWIWEGKGMTPLTSDEGAGGSAHPLWSLDGKRIFYTWDREYIFKGGLYWKASDGTGEAEKLALFSGRGIFASSWSKGGKSLVLGEVSKTQQEIGMLSMEGNHVRKELLHDEKYSAKEPRISPNGRWMAYSSNESGKFEVYVCSFPDVKGKRKVSVSGGNHPLWSPDGRELFYNNVYATMAVPVETDPQFKLNGMPTGLFEGTAGKILGPEWADMNDYTYWDIDPTGKRLFLMLKDDPAEAPRKINIVLNWLEELKQKVPLK
jgi:hypothetical protein